AYADRGFEYQENVVAAFFDAGDNFGDCFRVRKRFVYGFAEFFHQLLKLLIHVVPLLKSLNHASARVARTSKYSASTQVVPSVAVLYSVHNDSNCAARAVCPASSSRKNAVCVGPKYRRKNPTTSFGMNGYLSCALCRTKFREEVVLENLWRTVGSSPQSTGGGTEGGGGTILAVT